MNACLVHHFQANFALLFLPGLRILKRLIISCIRFISHLQQNNYAEVDGGVGYTRSGSGISIQGGNFTLNEARNTGGGFTLEDDSSFEVRNRKHPRNGNAAEGYTVVLEIMKLSERDR